MDFLSPDAHQRSDTLALKSLNGLIVLPETACVSPESTFRFCRFFPLHSYSRRCHADITVLSRSATNALTSPGHISKVRLLAFSICSARYEQKKGQMRKRQKGFAYCNHCASIRSAIASRHA
jgi:hypothetical protein